MLIDVGLPAICVILPPAPSLLQEDSSDACVSIDALASAAERLRSDGYSETTRSWNSRLPGQLVSACPDSLAHHPECVFSSRDTGFSATTYNPTPAIYLLRLGGV